MTIKLKLAAVALAAGCAAAQFAFAQSVRDNSNTYDNGRTYNNSSNYGSTYDNGSSSSMRDSTAPNPRVTQSTDSPHNGTGNYHNESKTTTPEAGNSEGGGK